MGSGNSLGYSKANGGSQEYASSYHVDKPMLEADKKRGTYHDGHYDKIQPLKTFWIKSMVTIFAIKTTLRCFHMLWI